MGIDLSTKAGVHRFCELRRKEMAGCFERLGQFEAPGGATYMAYVFARHRINGSGDPDSWTTGQELPVITAIPATIPRIAMELVPWDQRTALMGRVLKDFNRLTRSTGCVIMTEAWFKTAEGPKKVVPDGSRYGWVEKSPDRREALMMMLQHVTFGDQMWFAEIHREPTRLDPWSEKGGEVDKRHGRLAGLNDWRE